MTEAALPLEITFPKDADRIRLVAGRLATATTKGEIGTVLAEEIGRYTLADIQVISGRFQAEMARVPEPYRSRSMPYMTDQIFGAHHRLLAMYRSKKFSGMTQPVTDRERFDRFCTMIPAGCFAWDEKAERTPFNYTPCHRLFYYLVAAFTMFVLDRPGHPVGTPFPGGYSVEEKNGVFYCLIRDHEKEVTHSICNFCPAHQTPGL